MTLTTPSVSIIVPTYNRHELLRETIDSVRDQGYRDFECIVVDNGSSDETPQYLKELTRCDSRFIQYSTNGIKNANTARNIGLKNARGSYMIFLDSDDLLSPDCLYTRLKIAKKYDYPDFIATCAESFERVPGDMDLVFSFPTNTPPLTRMLYLDNPFQTASLFLRSDFLQSKNLYWNEDLAWWQDWEFFIRILLHMPNFEFLPVLDFYFRNGKTCDRISNKPRDITSYQGLFKAIEFIRSRSPCEHTVSLLKAIQFKHLLELTDRKQIGMATNLLKKSTLFNRSERIEIWVFHLLRHNFDTLALGFILPRLHERFGRLQPGATWNLVPKSIFTDFRSILDSSAVSVEART